MSDRPMRLNAISSQQKKKVSKHTDEHTTESLLAQAQKLKAQKKIQQKNTQLSEGTAETTTPTLTTIAVQKKNSSRFNLYLNGQFWLGVGEGTLVHFNLHKGQTLSSDQQQAIKVYEESEKAYQTALSYLSYQLRTRKEVYEKLTIESYTPEQIDRTIERLDGLRLIDDLAYGKSYVRTQMRIAKKGPNNIAYELKNKGLTSLQIEKALLEYPMSLQNDNALDLAQKRMSRYHGKYSYRESKQKVKQFLMNKGFLSESIQIVDEELTEQTVDAVEENIALKKLADKYWRKASKLTPSERWYKVKGQLYQKGFEQEAIQAYLAQLEEEG